MKILALDPAEYLVGWARGDAGEKPAIGVYRLREKDERTEDAIERFAQWLHGELSGIDLLVAEHFLPSGAMKGRTNDETREGQIGLGYAARSVAAVLKVPFRSPYPATIRKHFCGRAHAEDRASTKLMVIKQAQLLGYIPKTCFEDNMADAAALFDFSSSHWGRKASSFALSAPN